jgi:RNA polymerase sigma factor (sigma-70 family)
MNGLQNVVHRLRSAAVCQQSGLKDGYLLERFLAWHDQAAFAGLVHRHGRMVLGVCRRILRNHADAEDAFQATFLILVRKANSIVPRDNLANWLYGVANRTALKARMTMSRHETRQRRYRDTMASMTPAEKVWQDVLPLLDQELARLPDAYRSPIVLCDLEGKTRREAARQLGWPEGTVAGRLARGREMLAGRLARKGVLPATAALAGVLACNASAGGISSKLVAATTEGALAIATGASSVASGVIGAKVAALTSGVLRTMLISKLKLASALLCAAGILIGASGIATNPALGGGGAGEAECGGLAANQPADASAAGDVSEQAQADGQHKGLIATMGSAVLRHAGRVFFVSYVAGGRQIVSAGRDQTMRLWDASTGREIRRFDLSSNADRANQQNGAMMAGDFTFSMASDLDFPVATSPDGKHVAALDKNVLRIWELETGKEREAIRYLFPVGQAKAQMVAGGNARPGMLAQTALPSFVFSSDGKRLLVVMQGGVVRAWDVQGGKWAGESSKARNADKTATAWIVSGDGRYLAWQEGSNEQKDGLLKVEEIQTGALVATIQAGVGVQNRIHMTQFLADNKTLAWNTLGGELQILEIGKDKAPRPVTKAPTGKRLFDTALAFAPDDSRVAFMTNNFTIAVLDLKAGDMVWNLTAKPGDMVAVPSGAVVAPPRAFANWIRRGSDMAFSPDGKRLAASLGGLAVHQFDLETGKAIPRPGAGHATSILRLAIDGGTLVTCAAGDGVRLWNGVDGKEAGSLELAWKPGATVLSPNGKQVLAFRDGKIQTWDIASRQKIREVAAGQAAATWMAASPGANLLALRAPDNLRIRLIDAATGKVLREMQDSNVPETGQLQVITATMGGPGKDVVTGEVVFSPDGRFLAAANMFKKLTLWDVESGAKLWESDVGSSVAVHRFAFSPDGLMLVAVQGDGTLALIEATTGLVRRVIGEPRRETGSNTISVLSVGGGRYSLRFDDASENASSVAFSPAGRYVAASHASPGFEVWDVYAGKPAQGFGKHQGSITSLIFSADGKRIFSGSADTTAMAWDVSNLPAVPVLAKEELPAKMVVGLEADLAGKDAAKAYDAMRRLAGDGKAAVEVARRALKAVAAIDPKRVDQLIAELSDGKYDVRRKATAELEKHGELVVPALRDALRTDVSLEARQRMEGILAKITNAGRNPALVRDLRLVELLELVGTAEAREVLTGVSGGAHDARLTREAKQTLERIGR